MRRRKEREGKWDASVRVGSNWDKAVRLGKTARSHEDVYADGFIPDRANLCTARVRGVPLTRKTIGIYPVLTCAFDHHEIGMGLERVTNLFKAMKVWFLNLDIDVFGASIRAHQEELEPA